MCMSYTYALYECRMCQLLREILRRMIIYLICMPYEYALYVCLICMPYLMGMPCMYAFYECLHASAADGKPAKAYAAYAICMPYMYALYVCLICMPYEYALCACLMSMPYMNALYVCPICQLPMEILRWAIIAAAFVVSLKFITRNVRNVVISQV